MRLIACLLLLSACAANADNYKRHQLKSYCGYYMGSAWVRQWDMAAVGLTCIEWQYGNHSGCVPYGQMKTCAEHMNQ